MELAVGTSHDGLADACFRAGVGSNMRDDRKFDCGTLFQCVCVVSRSDTVSAFLKDGADFEAVWRSFANTRRSNDKPVYVTAVSGHASIVRLLLRTTQGQAFTIWSIGSCGWATGIY